MPGVPQPMKTRACTLRILSCSTGGAASFTCTARYGYPSHRSGTKYKQQCACTCARVARSPPACSSHMRNCGLRTACFVRNRMLVYKHAPKTHIIIVVIGLVHASLRGTHEPLQSLFCRCCQIPRSQVLLHEFENLSVLVVAQTNDVDRQRSTCRVVADSLLCQAARRAQPPVSLAAASCWTLMRR